MNKQEALKRIEVQKETIIRLAGWAVYVYIEELIKSLDEPQKPVVPQMVAEWIKKCKTFKSFAVSLSFALQPSVWEVNGLSDECIEWLADAENQETYARAWLDGYEIEKEKRYLVTIKGIVSNFMVLKHNINEDTWYMSNKINYTDLKAYHTKKELEDAGFGWVFDCDGIEVEEVTE